MYKHILVPIDPEHGAVGERLIALARLLAGGHGRITLLTVVAPVPGYVAPHIPAEILEANRVTARDQLEALAERTGIDPGSIALREGGASTTILDEAERLGADAIILGSHRPDFSDYLLGSTSARVVRHARCTVVVERSAPVSA
jgi:nucleotide-binding universal stress UspA family protein